MQETGQTFQHQESTASVSFAVASALACALGACSVIKTTADVVQTGASVVGTTASTTASVAKTTVDVGLKTATTATSVATTAASTATSVGSATMSAGSAAVSAGAAAKNATAATYGVAVAGAATVGTWVRWGMEFSRANDIEYTQVTAAGPNAFVGKNGTRIATRGCESAEVSMPALLVVQRSGDYLVRLNRAGDSLSCTVTAVEEVKP